MQQQRASTNIFLRNNKPAKVPKLYILQFLDLKRSYDVKKLFCSCEGTKREPTESAAYVSEAQREITKNSTKENLARTFFTLPIVGCTYRGTVVPVFCTCLRNCFVVVKVQDQDQRKVRHMYLRRSYVAKTVWHMYLKRSYVGSVNFEPFVRKNSKPPSKNSNRF